LRGQRNRRHERHPGIESLSSGHGIPAMCRIQDTEKREGFVIREATVGNGGRS
jgi:hypothetical protein